jgi:hypothetical protein
MRLLHSAARTSAGFEAENVVSLAGLVPVMRLSQEAGLPDLIAERVQLGTSIGCNPAGKIAAIVAGMVAGADSIEDLDVLRHGGMGRLFEAVYAPSTLGSFLREFTFGHVRQLDSAARSLLVSLAASCPRLTEGAAGLDVCGRGLAAAPDVRQGQAGRGVRAHQGRRIPGAAARALPADGHDLHRHRRPGDRRHAAARRERGVGPRGSLAGGRGAGHRPRDRRRQRLWVPRTVSRPLGRGFAATRPDRTLRRECLDHLLITGPRHLAAVLREYVQHYNMHRPHRSLHQRPPAGVTPPPSGAAIRPLRCDRLGGLLHEYVHVA